MKSSEFGIFKAQYSAAMREVLKEVEARRLDENGFPAYSHPNPLINWLFWQRLQVVMNYVEQSAPYACIMDFGCGGGVMIPFLAKISERVIATDTDLLPLEKMQKHFPLAANVEAYDAAKSPICDYQAGSFDLIIALDVLEHIKDLSRTLDDLLRLLKPGGRMVISGPTENFAYRLGRKLAGPEYSGDYHERGVKEIYRLLSRKVRVERVADLYWPIPLFEIFAAIP